MRARALEVPKGYALVRSGRVQEGDLLWVNARQEWSGPVEWNGVLALGADHKVPCNENCKVARKVPPRGRRTVTRSRPGRIRKGDAR